MKKKEGIPMEYPLFEITNLIKMNTGFVGKHIQ